MSRVRRTLGLARSLAIYHAVPFRQRRLRRLYGAFVRAGDLAFEVGAHVGNRSRALAAMGCRVVAVEPQPDFARLLRTAFRREDVQVVEAAVGQTTGRLALSMSDITPTMTTTATEWREALASDPRFAGVHWNREVLVDSVTLDDLIDRYGRPTFVKIDVEGAEPQVLAGLSRAVPVVSFEYVPWALDYARACVSRLRALGPYRFNWSRGESYELVADAWLDADELAAMLQGTAGGLQSGDVYARLEGESGPATSDPVGKS